jgi:uncharacterized protein YodC (DUF2158 family)
MSGETFKVGDTVELKSGGPVMTVTAFVKGSASVRCAWFTPDNTQTKVQDFPPEALKRTPGE